MPWAVAGAAVAAAGSIGGGILGANAQQSAASQEQTQQEKALQFQEGVYGNTVKNESPYLNTGTNALYSLSSLYGLGGAPGQPNTGQGATQAFNNFTSTPAYTFGLGQGELAANRGLAASGLTDSGAQAKALTQYGQGYASQGFNGYIGQLASLAGMGQNAAALEGSQGNQAATGVGNYLGNIGAAGAAGTIGSANSLTSGLGGAIGAMSNQNALGSLFGGGTSAYGNTTDVTAGTPAASAAGVTYGGS